MTNQKSSPKEWSVSWSATAKKQLTKLDRPIQKKILSFLFQRVLAYDHPTLNGKMLTGQLSGLWSYRVGDYRIIADIQEEELVILVVQLDHRRQVYDL